MIEAKLAVVRKFPAWIDIAGNVVYKQDAFGCKVILDVARPDILFATDKICGNINQKGDSNVGSQLYVYQQGKTLQQQINTKDKHYNVLELTNLEELVMMYIIIFMGMEHISLIEKGLYLSVPVVGDMEDIQFFRDHSGPVK